MPETSAMADLQDVVVVGAGQAGFQAAASLRDNGFAGRISLIGDEPGLPYQRPPLSKAYLTGATDRVALNLRPESFFTQAAIDLRTGQRVMFIDRARKCIRLSNETTLPYDHLVLATGARNRTLDLPGADLDGVLQLRSAGDADALRNRLPDIKRIAIIGAGFIGLELAALASSMGIAVTILEASTRPMSRALSETMSRFFLEAHQATGVRFVFDAVVTRIRDHQGRAIAVDTADGQTHPADLVLVGVGVVPNVELAADAGLAVANGIVVDAHLATADPSISAIGDCAAYPQPFAGGERRRIESVQNAVDHARCLAARLTGKPQPYRAVPWFWSDQGPFKLQIAGLPAPHDHHVVRGDPSSSAFSVFCFRDGRLAGVESVNKAADHMIARRLLSSGAALSPDEAANQTFDLKARATGSLAA
ncbi:NAD(P)/FAD-dependent oxidoreductase [Bradyrhizobium prioriisuperbiae]|uniref:NAD(P)/FAD-dependent oxidoreductase n=1 Tax=Bradyrhizobium prioriisuperbiae TaxID=2854389 RepID=UPI0028EF22DF|nr:FAD-dependent oxidoreductase [Bradyrhizobium prioritasuperba]